jgi:carbohydrate-selective porin OprB
VAPVRRHIVAGLVWTGPTATRPHDEIGLAFSYGLLTTQNDFSHGFENEIEGYYQIDVSHGLTIQPGVEYWQHPSPHFSPTGGDYSFGGANLGNLLRRVTMALFFASDVRAGKDLPTHGDRIRPRRGSR